MRSQGPGGPYYRLLNHVARFIQSSAIGTLWRVGVLVAIAATLLGAAWALANVYTLHAGEMPGTQAYDRVLFSYLMRLICGEAMVVGGVLLSARWAQQAGHIPRYDTAADERD